MTTNGTAAHPLSRFPIFVKDCEKSGLTVETIQEAGLYVEDDHLKLGMLLNFKYPKARGPALVFTFRDLDGNLNGHKRVKVAVPGKDRNGKTVKYLSPKGSGNRAYFPKRTTKLLAEASVEIVIVEGEKKALMCSQEGFDAVGLTGVYSWKEGKKADRLIPEIEALAQAGRKILICFDSDRDSKPDVKEAESRLAAQLTARGCVVKVVVLPDGPEGAKQGADDFLVAQGKVAFRKLLDSAIDPEPVDKQAAKVHADSLDPMNEARKFIEFNGKTPDGDLKVRTYRGCSHYHNGTRYKEQDEAYVVSLLYKYLDPVAKFITRGVVSNIMAAFRAQTIIPADRAQPLWLNGREHPENFIAVQNGILNIDAVLRGESNVLTPHTPLWFSSVCLPYPFEPKAECPKWINSVERNLDGDEQRIAILQEFIGYSLMFDTSFQKFLVMSGEGGTGKSTACAMMTAILGCANVSHLPLELFGQRFQTFQTLGKLANIAFDCGEIDKTAEGTIKSLVSGDRMTFERKYHDNVDAIPTARLVLATNNLPRFSDRSSGIWRRMLLMPFKRVVPEVEKVHGMDKPDWWEAQGELPGAFNWAIEGLRRLREQRRFTTSEICETDLAQYRMECNPCGMFLNEHFEADPEADIVTQEAYIQYSAWAKRNGFHALASNTFGKEIVRAFPKAEPGKVYGRDGRRVPGYTGVKQTVSVDNPEGGFW